MVEEDRGSSQLRVLGQKRRMGPDKAWRGGGLKCLGSGLIDDSAEKPPYAFFRFLVLGRWRVSHSL